MDGRKYMIVDLEDSDKKSSKLSKLNLLRKQLKAIGGFLSYLLLIVTLHTIQLV